MWLQQTFESAILLEQHLGNYPKGVIKHGHPRTQWGIGNFFPSAYRRKFRSQTSDNMDR
jgi:hypothetical protein